MIIHFTKRIHYKKMSQNIDLKKYRDTIKLYED